MVTIRSKIQILFRVFFCAFSLISCNAQLQDKTISNSTAIETKASVSSVSTELPSSDEVAAISTPKVQATLTNVPLQAENVSLNQTPTPITPVIMKSIVISDIPFNPGGGPGAMLAIPGQVWTGTLFSGLQQWDPNTGNLVRTISGIEATNYFDIEFENDRLWVLASIEDPNQAEILYVIELPQGEIVKEISIGMEGDYGTAPTQLGSSPGKIWVNFGIVDTETLEYGSLPDGLPSEAHFVYDGENWMWITGSWCHGCSHDLWLVNANDPLEHKDDQNSGVLDTGVLGQPLVLANGKMWLIAHYNTSDGAEYLDGYEIHKTNQPEIHIDVTREIAGHGQANITADDKMVWVEAEGTLYFFDLLSGQKMGELKVGDTVEEIGFDGTSLWVLCSDKGLLQIFLPWAS